MSDERADAPPDLAALAKRFLDLWQEQVTALAGDPELARGMSRFLAAMPPGFPLWPGAAVERAARAASAAAASDGGGGAMVELARRLDAIERRLDRLEGGAAAKRGGPRRKPKKRSA